MPDPEQPRHYSKSELEMARIRSASARFAAWLGLFRLTVVGLIILGSIYLIFQGIRPILGREASAIEALASVVRAFALPKILWALVSLGTSSAWLLERRGKKRALREKAELQRRIEGGDPHRSSSGNPI